jgi:hypothetical protein
MIPFLLQNYRQEKYILKPNISTDLSIQFTRAVIIPTIPSSMAIKFF